MEVGKKRRMIKKEKVNKKKRGKEYFRILLSFFLSSGNIPVKI
jgi:hypothetical protein